MTDCEDVRESLVLYAEGELSAEQSRSVKEHLARCVSCRQEAAGIGEVRSWLLDPDLFLPQDYGWEPLPSSLAARAKGRGTRWVPLTFGSLAWAASVAACVLLGLIFLQTVRDRSSLPGPSTINLSPADIESLLRRIQSAHARDATARYLNECQDLLLNLVRAEKNCAGDRHDLSLEVERARELLQRKRMLNTELRAPEVSRAKELCDELENLLVSLSTAQKCENSGELRLMERSIEKQQILLRINLLRAELS
jgi:hypothetical protein